MRFASKTTKSTDTEIKSGTETVRTPRPLILMLLSASLSILLLLVSHNVDRVIEISIGLSPGGKYGPYLNGTYHHTRVISKSSLVGRITVEGAAVTFNAYGYNTEHLRNVSISRDQSFEVSPAGDLYIFSFENRANSLSVLRFVLEERWMNLLFFVPGLLGLAASVSGGVALMLARRREQVRQT